MTLPLQVKCPFCYTIFGENAAYIKQNHNILEKTKGNSCPRCNAFECVGIPINTEGFDLRVVGSNLWLQINVNSVRKHKFFTTWTGIQFYPFEVTEDMIDIRDIAHSCAQVARFGGHLDSFYSSGQHQIVVAEHCTPKNKLKALLHDSTDAYMGDVVSPMKYHPMMTHYRAYEGQLLALIFRKYGLTIDIPEEIHMIDKAAEAAECRDLSNKTWWQDTSLVLPTNMCARPEKENEAEYLRLFERLTK